jgi:NTP pyrophosphatase (non-canonical NTP hydrolase)
MKLDNEVFKEALKQWGYKAQVGMCVEEMGEALAKINQLARGRIDYPELVEEFVDVYIMMCQMRFLNQGLFDTIFEQKVSRLRKRLHMKEE